MTRERAKELLPVITAFAEGKAVQWLGFKEWRDDGDPTWGPSFEYRIKPEPVLRPWRPDEVPVGCLLRGNDWTAVLTHTIGAFESLKICAHPLRMWYLQGLVNSELKHSTDGGKTWLPCGVVEEAK